MYLSWKIYKSSLLTLMGSHWHNWNLSKCVIPESYLDLHFCHQLQYSSHQCWLHCFAMLAGSPRNYCNLDRLYYCIFKRFAVFSGAALEVYELLQFYTPSSCIPIHTNWTAFSLLTNIRSFNVIFQKGLALCEWIGKLFQVPPVLTYS